jgi:hypothetical protein
LEFDAIDPKNPPDKRWKVGLPEWLIHQQQIHGHEKAMARLRLVLEVLQEGTTRLYEGWSRPGKEDKCFVYVGRPDRDYKSHRIETPPPPGMVFLIFVLEDGTIDDWTWRKTSAKDADSPEGVSGRLIWSRKPS